MRFDETFNKGEKTWGCSYHSITQFIDRNKFVQDHKEAIMTLLKMMNNAIFLCYDKRDKIAEIYTNGNWIFVTKESTIVTVYEKRGSIYEHLIA